MKKLINLSIYQKVKDYFLAKSELNYSGLEGVNNIYTNLKLMLSDEDITEEQYYLLLSIVEYYCLDYDESYAVKFEDESILINGKDNNLSVDSEGTLTNFSSYISVFLLEESIETYCVFSGEFECVKLEDNLETIINYIKKQI